MRILIHAVAAHDGGGAGRHLIGFLPALVHTAPLHHYMVYVNDRLSLGPLLSNFEVHRLPVQSTWQRLWWDQTALPHLIQKGQARWCPP